MKVNFCDIAAAHYMTRCSRYVTPRYTSGAQSYQLLACNCLETMELTEKIAYDLQLQFRCLIHMCVSLDNTLNQGRSRTSFILLRWLHTGQDTD